MNPLAERITQYLIAGGLFNPEQMEHSKVRDLLMDCRTTINILEVSHGEHDALNTAREIENIRALTQIDRTLQIESILRKSFLAIKMKCAIAACGRPSWSQTCFSEIITICEEALRTVDTSLADGFGASVSEPKGTQSAEETKP